MALEDIAGYSLRRGLGSGSVGTVWLLRNLASGRHAVLKRIPVAAVPDVEGLRSDLALAQRLDHPHVARLIEVRQTDREWLLVSQYVVAGTLTGLLDRRGPLSLGELVTLVSPLAQALGAIHRVGLTHGHLHAGSIMFDAEGRPIITDAGLRQQVPPAEPANDLAELQGLALAAGGDPAIFTLDVFAADGDEVCRRILQLASPEAINLGFSKDPELPAPLPAPPPGPLTTPPPAPLTAPPSADTADPAPPPLAQETPPPAASSATELSAGGLSVCLPRRATARTRRMRRRVPRRHRGRHAGWLSAARNKTRGGRSSRKRTAGRRPPASWQPPNFATNQAPNELATSRGRSGVVGVVRRGLRQRSSAYGLLAVAGLAAAIVVVIGLITVGVLGRPAGGPASAADGRPHPTESNQPGSSSTPTPGESSTTHPTTTNPTTSQSSSPEPSTNSSPSPGKGEESGRWLETLQALDVRRSQAFWTLDTAGLDAVYVTGSSPWLSDRSLIADYKARQLRIDGLRLQIESLVIEQPGAGTVVLRVVDRLVSGVLVDRTGRRTPLPTATATTRRITLTGGGTSWRITAVTKA